MPIYTYKCKECGAMHDRRSSVEIRDVPWACSCGGSAPRVFTPSANIFVHDHFRVMQSDFLPEKGEAAWADLQGGTGSQVRQPKVESFQEHFDRTYKGCG